MRGLILIFLLAASCTSFRSNEPTLVSINLIDREGMSETVTNDERLKRYVDVDFLAPQPYVKVLRVYKTKDANVIPSYVTSYYPNGQPKQYLEVMNGRAKGAYREWYQDGSKKLEGQVIGGIADVTTEAEKSWLFDGVCHVWSQDGSLQAVIPYDKGSLSGTSIYYHPNGKISRRAPFINGQLEGDYEVYREDGSLLQRIEYHAGVLNGTAVGYWEDGSVSFQEFYYNNKLGSGAYHDAAGTCLAKVEKGKGWRAIHTSEGWELQEFYNGVLEGEVKVMDKRGNLLRRYHVKNDAKNGEEVIYYQTAANQPKLSVNWVDNNIQGLVKTWYENGVQESQREMLRNVKNGLLTGFYKDGNLMLIEEYDMGKLVKGKYYRRGDKNPVSKVIGGRGLATLFDGDGNYLRKINYNNGHPTE